MRASSKLLPEPAIAEVAALIGDGGRAAMLCALMNGDALPAGALARCAGLAANAASAHLNKLVSGGLLSVSPSGRQRYYRLRSEHVARAVEALSAIAKPVRIVALSQSRIAQDLQCARSCYDHLAGRLGVAVTEALLRKRLLVESSRSSFEVTKAGAHFFCELGIDLAQARLARRHFAAQCIDWSERRPHLAGALGAAVRDLTLQRGWVIKKPGGRALRITDRGRLELRAALSIEI